MEHFAQTNVFARIRAVFARIQTVFAHLIIGCAIRYPKIGHLRYMVDNIIILTIVLMYYNDKLSYYSDKAL